MAYTTSMSIHEVKLANLRSYVLYEAQLDPHSTLILGSNGSGKTTLLEALYVGLRGTSFRGRDADMMQHGALSADIKITATNGDDRRVHLEPTSSGKVSKAFQVAGKTTARLPAKYRLPVVLFEPDELRLLSSSPQRRRQFLDDILARLYPAYATTLSRYGRTLLQRNELLKQRDAMPADAWDNHLFAWDIKFAELATKIVQTRHDFIATSNQHLSRLYSGMADAQHVVEVRYESNFSAAAYEQALVQMLQSRRHDDALRGYTSAGPHRDDITILLDTHPASETASRGEMRTIMLAYKLLEVELQQKLTDTPPLILMDDVFSELDITRERSLMHTLQGYQTVITATDLRDELKVNASIISL